MSNKSMAIIAVTSMSVGLVALAPAQAGSNWGGPQEVSSRFGRALTVSDNGRVAAWVRTNRADSWATGPARTAWYLTKKKRWTPSAPIPGAVESMRIQLSNDGNSALIESPGEGYLMSQRTKGNTWSTAEVVVSGANLGSGTLAGSASTVFYIDWGVDDDPTPTGTVYSTSRRSDGTWTIPALVGYAYPEGRYNDYPALTVSKDGSTLVWLTDTYALVGSTLNDDGSWGSARLIRQYGSDPDMQTLALSADGSRVIWTRLVSDGILTSTRSGSTWSTVSSITVDETYSAAVSPNGLNVAWSNTDRQMVIRRWKGSAWKRVKVLGSAGYYSQIALQNKTMAWTYTTSKSSTLRSVLFKGGRWQRVVKHSSTSYSPAVSYDSKTLVWAATGSKRIYSVKR